MSTTFTVATFTDITTYATVSVYAIDSFAASGKPPLHPQVPFKLQGKPLHLIRSVKLTTPATDSFLDFSKTFSGFTPAAATSILAETPSSSSSSSPSRLTRVPAASGSSFSSSSSSAASSSQNDVESLRMRLGVSMWASLVVGVGGLMVWL
jgi:hypothetical protein